MKTYLIDKNNIEIQIGDKYKCSNFDTIFIIFWKGGAICGGVTFDVAQPLCWDIDEYNTNSEGDPIELNCDTNLDWLELITTNEA